MHLEMNWHGQDGELLPVALWCPGPGYRMISSGLTGGGIGPREWVLNAQVPAGYSRMDPAVHIAELAADFGLKGEGVGLLTAAKVAEVVQCDEEGVRAAATVGLRVPTWARCRLARPIVSWRRSGVRAPSTSSSRFPFRCATRHTSTPS
jgi:adenosylcobinamide amidohydrolase